MVKLYLFFLVIFAAYYSGAQSAVLVNTYEPQNEAVKLVAHADSSLFIISIKGYEKSKRDFYISNHPLNKNEFAFDTCLHISNLFDGKLDTKTFKYSIFQCNENLIFVFDVYAGTHKKVIAKVINFTGKVSDAFVLDDSDLSNTELMECNYSYRLTEKKELLITLRRKYKSGFQRDKFILYDEYMNKLWDFEPPKISYHYQVNVLEGVYGSNQLIYSVENGFVDKTSREWIINNDRDTIVKFELDSLNYNLRVPKDSLCLIVVNPVLHTSNNVKVHWPFKKRGVLIPISSSQIILYNLVDVEDENHVLPGRKAMYYKRIDIKNNVELYEDLIPLTKTMQQNLTYNMGRASSKPFGLLTQKLEDGKLLSLFVNQFYNEAEIIVSCFNIALNKFEWVHLLPRKLSTKAYSSIDAITFSYSNKKVGVGYYENRLNFGTPLNLYKHKKYKMARGVEDTHFIEVTIDEIGSVSKKIVNESSVEFLFPWFNNKAMVDNKHFFYSNSFLPVKYIYKF